jgi:hypothetical protein
MAELKMGRSSLAKAIGRDPSSITVLFRPDTIQSRLVPDIHAALGLEEPSAPEGSPPVPVDQVDAEMQELFSSMSPEDKKNLLYWARRILGKSSQ